jgi:hypothetical protein
MVVKGTINQTTHKTLQSPGFNTLAITTSSVLPLLGRLRLLYAKNLANTLKICEAPSVQLKIQAMEGAFGDAHN